MAKAISRRIDVLGYGRGRRKNCVETVRKAAREEPANVWKSLAEHRCDRCGDALLRMAELIAFNNGAAAGLDVVRKAGVAPLTADLKCRSLTLRAHLLRCQDRTLALSLWNEALKVDASVREHADAWRRGAFILAEAAEFAAARSALLRARRLHVLADRVSPAEDAERYLGAVDSAVIYIEGTAHYMRHPADLRLAVLTGVRMLQAMCYGEAPRTWLAGLTNLLGAVVCAWRTGIAVDVRPAELVRMAEAAQRTVPRNSMADISLRWLRTLALTEMYGLTPQTLGMFERVQRALVAEERFNDAVRVLLDVLWFDAYGSGAGSPDRETWVDQANQIVRLARRHGGLDMELLSQWSQACRHGIVHGRLVEKLMYDVRGVRVSAPTVRLSARVR